MTPPVYARLQDQIYPVFAPIPGSIDVCGVDSAKICRALRAVQNLTVNENKVDYGVGLLDGCTLEYFVNRRVNESKVFAVQDEFEVLRSFQKQGEFYAFGENVPQQQGLLSGGRKNKPLVMSVWRADGVAQTAGSAAVLD